MLLFNRYYIFYRKTSLQPINIKPPQPCSLAQPMGFAAIAQPMGFAAIAFAAQQNPRAFAAMATQTVPSFLRDDSYLQLFHLPPSTFHRLPSTFFTSTFFTSTFNL
jgi:hypothetical protein